MIGPKASAPALPVAGATSAGTPLPDRMDMNVYLRWRVGGLAVLTAAAALRALALTDRSLTWDETYSVFIASQSVQRIVALTAANEAHPPLYYLLLHWWMQIFGAGDGPVRALSIPIGAGVVLVTWLFGRRLVGEAPALLAAALVALAPSQVAMSQEARMYGLLALAVLGSWWALWAGAVEGRRAAWLAYAIAVAVTLHAHYYGFFVAASHVGYLLWRRTPAAVWRRWTYAALAAVVLSLPWLVQLPVQLATGRAWPIYRPPVTPALYADALTSITVGQFFFDAIHGGSLPREVSWPLAAGAAAVVAIGYRALRGAEDTRKLMTASVVFPLTLAYGVSLFVNVFAPRYLTFLMPGMALLGGVGVVALAQMRARRRVAAVAAAVAVLFVSNVGSLVRYYQLPRLDFFDWRAVSRTLAAGARDDDALVFLPGFARMPVDYYFRGPQLRLALTPDGQDAVGPAGARLPAIVAMLGRHPRVWIITVPPVPPAVETMLDALGRRAYRIQRQEHVNRVILIQTERPPVP